MSYTPAETRTKLLSGPADYTIEPDVSFVVIDAAGGNVSVTFPAAATRLGKTPIICKRMDSAPNSSIVTLIGTFDGMTNFILPNMDSGITCRAITGGYALTTSYNSD